MTHKVTAAFKLDDELFAIILTSMHLVTSVVGSDTPNNDIKLTPTDGQHDSNPQFGFGQ